MRAVGAAAAVLRRWAISLGIVLALAGFAFAERGADLVALLDEAGRLGAWDGLPATVVDPATGQDVDTSSFIHQALHQERIQLAVEEGWRRIRGERALAGLVDAIEQARTWRHRGPVDAFFAELDEDVLRHLDAMLPPSFAEDFDARVSALWEMLQGAGRLDVEALMDVRDVRLALDGNPRVRDYLRSLPGDPAYGFADAVTAALVRRLDEDVSHEVLERARAALATVAPTTDLVASMDEAGRVGAWDAVPATVVDPATGQRVDTSSFIHQTLRQEWIRLAVDEGWRLVRGERALDGLVEAIEASRLRGDRGAAVAFFEGLDDDLVAYLDSLVPPFGEDYEARVLALWWERQDAGRLDVEALLDAGDVRLALQRNPSLGEYVGSLDWDPEHGIGDEVATALVRRLEEDVSHEVLERARTALGTITPTMDLTVSMDEAGRRGAWDALPATVIDPATGLRVDTLPFIHQTLRQERIQLAVEEGWRRVRGERALAGLMAAVEESRTWRDPGPVVAFFAELDVDVLHYLDALLPPSFAEDFGARVAALWQELQDAGRLDVEALLDAGDVRLALHRNRRLGEYLGSLDWDPEHGIGSEVTAALVRRLEEDLRNGILERARTILGGLLPLDEGDGWPLTATLVFQARTTCTIDGAAHGDTSEREVMVRLRGPERRLEECWPMPPGSTMFLCRSWGSLTPDGSFASADGEVTGALRLDATGNLVLGGRARREYRMLVTGPTIFDIDEAECVTDHTLTGARP